jgi:RNA polymerase sigma factor (sigma-70 family)
MARGHSEGRFVGQIRTLFEVGYLGDLPDEQLIERFRSGEDVSSEAAFAALIRRHGPMVLGVCRRLLADPHLAEDAFQATFVVLARRAGSVRDRAALGAWLHRVARRIATRLKVQTDRRNARERPLVVEVAVDLPDRVEHDEVRAAIDEEIDRLGHDQRIPFVLCCLEGLSHEEASQRLRWPIGTVKSRLARGRRRLQDRLTRRGLAPSSAIAAASGVGLVGLDASAAVPPALVEATSKAVAASLVGGGLTAGAVPAAVSALVREVLGSMIALKLKLAAIGTMAAVGSVATIGLALAIPPAGKPPGKLSVVTVADTPQAEAKPTVPAISLSASGRVVDGAGRAIPGARVVLREWSQYRLNELSPKDYEEVMRTREIVDIVAETKSDAGGQFRFQDIAAPGFSKYEHVGNTVFPWDVVALEPGRGLAWEPLSGRSQRTPITLVLGDEGIVRGRVVEPGGRPVGDAKVKVIGIDPLGRPDVNGVGTDNRLNLSWSAFPLGSRTDADGRFAIGGLPRDRIASLIVREPGHEQLFVYAATTDEPQADAIGRTFLSGKAIETRRPVHTGEFTLTAKRTDHILTGRVVFEADGKPAAKAKVLGGPVDLTTDEAGRFRIEGIPSGKLVLHAMAFDTDAAPFDGEVTIPEEPGEFAHDIILPRGMILNGRVVDGSTGLGVEKVHVYYLPKYEADQVPTLFGLNRETGADGRFRLVVPPGRGTLDLRVIPPGFPQPERRVVGGPGDPRFSREVEGRGGQAIDLADFKLAKGGVVTLRVVDPEGRPLPDAQVDIRDLNRGFNQKPGRSDAEGRFAVAGLESGRETVVDIVEAGRKLGATVEVTDQGPAAGAVVEVRLQPLVAISGRVLDEDGKPLAGALARLYRDVAYPGQSGRSFGSPVATVDEIGQDGTYSFDTLIPGATYNTHVEARGHATATSRHVTIKPGQPIRLDDFRLPSLDQEVKGTVVDVKGKPVAGISVGYQRADRTQSMYAPNGAVWFMDTDELGRFHLTQLPRGPIRLQAYRHPGGADRTIRDMRYLDVQPGQADVRIEIRDRNDRLRGID